MMTTKINVLQVIPKLGYGGAETGCYDIAHYLAEQDCGSFIATSDFAHVYAKDDTGSAEIFVKDEAGNVTKISPHNEQGEWEYFSRNVNTGKVMRVNMEELIKDIEKLTGKQYIREE